MRVLTLDDDIERQKVFKERYKDDELTQVFNYDQAIEALATMTFDLICFDHDLSYEAQWGLTDEKTGLDVAKYLITLPKEVMPKLAIVHSYNPIGAKRIAYTIEGYVDRIMIQPFDPTTVSPK